MFGGAASGGFWSNVNVAVQQVHTTPDTWRALSAPGFKKVSATIITERTLTVSGRPAVEYDYEARMENQAMRFPELCVIDRDRVIMVTCTAPKEDFARLAPEFRASVASLKLDR